MLPADWPHDALPRETTLNGYRIQAILGHGGFGITYEAVDELDQRFAVKECFPRQFVYRDGLEVSPISEAEREAFQDCRDRFLREARALAQLQGARGGGDGVVKVITYFRAYGTAYIVMELLSGDTLEGLITQNNGNFEANILEEMFECLLTTLDIVHESGLLHRDIKPSNIILRENRLPILIDFGAARTNAAGKTNTFTQIYSESYAPIEQILATTQGPMSDIYAAGATFYKAIGGKAVDAFSRQQAVLLNKPDPQPPAIEVGAGRYETAFLRALDAALRVQPDQRPQSAIEMIRLLASGQDDQIKTKIIPVSARETHTSGNQSVTTSSELNLDKQADAKRLEANISKPGRFARKSYFLATAMGVLLVGVSVTGILLFLDNSKTMPRQSASTTASSMPELLSAKPTPVPSGAPAAPPEPSAAPALPPESSAADALAKGNAAVGRKDYAEAMRWYRKAADLGNADALNDIGDLYRSGWGVPQDYAQAMSWFRKAADQGNARAQSNIGWLYVRGWGVPQDYAQAMSWFRKAADQGNREAQRHIGTLYHEGLGVPLDYAQAMSWYQKAADQGDPMAKNDIGLLYKHGQGVTQDYAQAMTWFRKAADQGYLPAETNIGLLYKEGEGVTRDYAQAMSWFQKAADQGSAVAEVEIGLLYRKGEGVAQDYAQAMSWFRMAAEQGDAFGQNNVGFLFQNGWGVPQDYVQAMTWYRKAADQGYPTAEANVGLLYKNGQGVARDYAQAMSWFQKAADQNYAVAEDEIAILYEQGLGVPKDLAMARLWRVKAATSRREKRNLIYFH